MIGTLFMALTASISPITAPGPQGPLSGTLVQSGKHAPVVLIVPGSGPTDRDGNNPLGVTASSYRLLAEALDQRGVSSVRIDKRGMFESKQAVPDANAVTIGDYVSDTRSWVSSIRERTGASCVWLLGHSEGGLVALAAAQQPDGICGLILVAAPGRSLGVLMREQLRANPANAPLLEPAFAAIESFEAGERVDVAALHPALQALFAPQVQPFLIDMMGHDPAALAATADLPMLIIHGGRDIQVARADFDALRAARPQAEALLVEDMSHVLKTVTGEGRAASVATYNDGSLPVSARLADGIAQFVKQASSDRRN